MRRALVWVVLLVAGAAPAHAQVSPGPLAKAHRDLDQPLRCFDCHVRGNPPGGMDRRCLACHQEIATLRARNRGYHARVAKQACASCHPDHGGRDFALIAWEDGAAERFDHRRAGYALRGAHARAECRDCHQPKHQRAAVARALKVPAGASWLGLETTCASCHEDPHRGEIGADCRRCHDENAWKPTPGFDHARTRYPLTGAHREVECASCHVAPGLRPAHGGAVRTAEYRPVPHAECSSCHQDPHRARFGSACSSCHGTTSFTAIRGDRFDHDRTRYPLRGGHAKVACAACHGTGAARTDHPPFERCGSCHRDAHAGQATIAGAAADCETCHRVASFAPSTFTAERHASAWPLAGAHATAECAGCHRKSANAADAARLGAARVELRPAHERCADCHRDPHAGALDARGACTTCHRMDAFHPSTVDVAVHAGFDFALEGAHRAVPCQACHAELKERPAASTLLAAHGGRALRFEAKAAACADCHDGPHGDQFGAATASGACERCHDASAFAPAARFDHARTAFRLEGAHARAACASCHPAERGAGGAVRVRYRPVSTACESCHGDGTTGANAPGRRLLPVLHVAHRAPAARPPRDAIALLGEVLLARTIR